ncbi:hypothetical protein GF324_02170 [bacterium]|nr:hypothetical protein [bacterium]
MMKARNNAWILAALFTVGLIAQGCGGDNGAGPDVAMQEQVKENIAAKLAYLLSPGHGGVMQLWSLAEYETDDIRTNAHASTGSRGPVRPTAGLACSQERIFYDRQGDTLGWFDPTRVAWIQQVTTLTGELRDPALDLALEVLHEDTLLAYAINGSSATTAGTGAYHCSGTFRPTPDDQTVLFEADFAWDVYGLQYSTVMADEFLPEEGRMKGRVSWREQLDNSEPFEKILAYMVIFDGSANARLIIDEDDVFVLDIERGTAHRDRPSP